MIAEPRFRVLFVWTRLETRIWTEVRRGPLPGVADHLTTAEGAVAQRHLVYVDTPWRAPIQVGSISGRLLFPPRIGSLAVFDNLTVRREFRTSSHLPFGLGRKSTTGPAAVRFGFIPVDVNHRGSVTESQPLIESPAEPRPIRLASPVHRVLSILGFSPPPACLTPQPGSTVTTIIHECGKLSFSDGGLRNRERLEVDDVLRLFVVERESGIARANRERSTGNKSVTRDHAVGLYVVCHCRHLRSKCRSWISQGLTGVCDRFRMHLFVKERQLQKVVLA